MYGSVAPSRRSELPIEAGVYEWYACGGGENAESIGDDD